MDSEQLNRRQFLAKTVALGAGAALAVNVSADAAKTRKVKITTPKAKKIGWDLAVQLYTFRDRSFYEALDVLAGIGVCNVEPAFFLPLSKEQPDLKTGESLSPAQRREMRARLDDCGMKMPNYYAPVDGNTANFTKIFDFATEMGVKTIVAEPPAEVFDELEKLCDKYKINLAIHNHPKSPDSKYWSPDNVLAVCEGQGKRIGACPDTGHYIRSGLDPIECLRKLKGRIITMHLKDVIESGKPEARDVPLGAGKANYTEVLKELYALKFRGVMTVEYEHLSPQLAEDVAKCVKFVEDFAASLKGKRRRI